MKKGIKYRIHQYTSLLLIVVMAMLTFNQSANIHTHQLNDGTTITHAHPYQKTNSNKPVDSHHHDQKTYTFIGLLEILFFANLLTLIILLTPKSFIKCINLYIHKDRCDSKRILGRAPPIINSYL